MKNKLIFSFILGMFLLFGILPLISAAWEVNTSINASLPDIGDLSAPSVFKTANGFWNLISGDLNGVFYGYSYDGNNWAMNGTINASLLDIGDQSTPNVFYKDVSWYLLTGEYGVGEFTGFAYSGTTWSSNTSINSGLDNLGHNSAPSVFYMDGTWYLISGERAGRFYGYDWDGTQWERNFTINASLPDIGDQSAPSVFQVGDNWYLISGESTGNFLGFKWNGAGWDTDFSINASLPDIGSYSTPTIFNTSETQYFLISGEQSGKFFGFGYSIIATPPNISVNLTYPLNNSVISTNGIDFTSNLTIGGYNHSYQWANITYNVWFSNGTLFNSTLISGLSGNQTNTTQFIDNFNLGNYFWNARACYNNASFGNCTSGNFGNLSFEIGASLLNLTYSNLTYETKSETFTFNIELLEGSSISVAQLVYNGTNYTISNITAHTGYYTFVKTIDIPININPYANQTNEFFLRFTYEGTSTQEFTTYEQNISLINLTLCDATSTFKSINFTLTDEIKQSAINATSNPITFQAFFNYWIGSGTTYKNYSFGELNNNTHNSFEFCIDPTIYGIRTNMTSLYSATGFSENEYYLNNANLTTAYSNITLFLLNESNSVKFTATTKQGTEFINGAYVTIAKFFIGDGQYKTISVRKTDDVGKFVEYLELDRDYRYSIVSSDGELLGVIDKRSECSTAPCELLLQLDSTQGNIWDSYTDVYANGILSNLTYNYSSKIVTYSFIDTTGLAQYFRLEVLKGSYNETTSTICNSYQYTTFGTITCNLTGYNGDFTAKTYISRSPEKLDKVLSILIGEIKETLGAMALFISIILILIFVFAGVALSGGNPSVIIFMFGLGVLITKLITFLPFSWGIVALIELVVIWFMSQLRT